MKNFRKVCFNTKFDKLILGSKNKNSKYYIINVYNLYRFFLTLLIYELYDNITSQNLESHF